MWLACQKACKPMEGAASEVGATLFVFSSSHRFWSWANQFFQFPGLSMSINLGVPLVNFFLGACDNTQKSRRDSH